MHRKGLIEKYGIENENELKEILNKIKNKEVFVFTVSGKIAAGKNIVGDLISIMLRNMKKQVIIDMSFGHLVREEIDQVIAGYRKSEDKEGYAVKVDSTKKDLEKLSNILGENSIFDRTDEARLSFQFWKNEVRTKQEINYWINKMSKFIIEYVDKGYSINIIDAKFPNEIELIEDLGGKVIRLDVSEEIRKERVKNRNNSDVSNDTFRNASELALDDYDFDKTFDGTKLPGVLADEGMSYINS